jgi:hypothetical protein
MTGDGWASERQHRAQNHDQPPRHVDVRGDRFDEIPCNWDTMSIDALWRLFNERRPTPQSVIEALIWTVRERGPKALSEPTNLERLRRCDEAALAEIDRRLTLGEAAHA